MFKVHMWAILGDRPVGLPSKSDKFLLVERKVVHSVALGTLREQYYCP